ncbi:MAG: hypothetical protein IJP38_06040, partial [Oscillospiraceae bacterium]|nr:hypothetical protein [Oscillospiraceae bacterium]
MRKRTLSASIITWKTAFFVACEKAGYNILDSVRIARASIAAEITPAEYKEYVSAYGSEEEASFQLQIYKLFEDKLDAEYKSEYTELMKEGYSHTALRNTYDVAKTIDVSIKSIVPNDPEPIAVTGTETDLEKFAAKNFCDVTKLQKVVASKNINTTELIEGKERDVVKSEEITISAESDLSQTAELNSTSSSSFAIDSPIHSLKHEFISAPSVNDYPAANEEINKATGGVGYRENIVDLKGKNGLDLDLDLVFTPNSNMYFGSAGGVRTDWFNNAGVNATAIDTPLGIGWSFNLPFVSYTYEYDLSVSARNRHVYRYHMKDGGAYKIIDDPDSTNMILEDYPRDDIHVERISGYADSIPLRYKVVFADGRYETFDENGQIRETGDRFGNKITYDYYMEYNGVLNHNDGVPGALGRITDSLGRKVEIGYQQNQNFADRLVNIMLPDYSLIQFSLEAEDFDEPYLLQYITNRPGNTTFTYRTDVMYCTDEPYIIGNIITTSDGRNYVANLAAITYNTGLTSRFSYETVDVNNGVGGVKQVMRVTERYESYTNEDVYDIDQVLKYAVYDYTWDYSGYSRRKTAIASQQDLYSDPNNLPDTYSYMVGKTENLIRDYTIFNSNHQARGLYIQQAFEDDDGYYNLRRETYTFDEYQMPIRKQVYHGTKVKSIELFENDSKGNVLKHWSVYSDDEQNDEYLTTYTYSPAYNLLTSATYKQNADKTITETYTLSSDGKTVTQKEVKENNVVKERTGYTYDTYGNITKERKYITETEYTDVNYEYTDTVGKTRPTGSSFNGAYLTKMWQSGGNDIDGEAIGNVQYTYEYDDRGRQIKTTDPLGNTTTYTYDTFNRITQIKNPDNKTQTFSYVLNSTANTTTHTDEMGTQTKYTYDSANNLLSIIDVASGEELKSYTYDRWYRPVEERNVQLMTSGQEIFYTYDGLNRILVKETKNYDGTTVAKELGDYNFGETKEWNITTITTVGDTTYAPDVETVEYVNKFGDVDKIGYVTGTNEYFTTYKYDYLGNKTEELSALADQKDWTNTFTSKWEYDYAGRVTKEYDADSKYTLYEY